MQPTGPKRPAVDGQRRSTDLEHAVLHLSFDTTVVDQVVAERRDFSSARDEVFDEDVFRKRASTKIDFSTHVEPSDLPKRPGIYLIAASDFSQAYVGLAGNIHHRFHNKQYGHLVSSPDTCRASRVLASDYKIFVLEEVADETGSLGHAEIDYFFLLSGAGLNLTNADWTLGKAGQEGRPVVSADVRTGEHDLFASVVEAAATLFGEEANPGLVACCLPSGKTGHQDQCSGYTHRYATVEEISSGEVLQCFDEPWLEQLAGRIKEPYSRHAKSGFVGVTVYKKNGLWQVTLNCGRWPSGRVKKHRFTKCFADAEEGARLREDYIIKNGLQSLNRSNFGGW